MDILSLRYFLAAAEYSSFSKAAKASYTTQSNISKHIRKMENELQVQLFNRKGHRIELTEVGKKCVLDIKRIVEEFNQLKVKVRHYQTGEHGNLIIGSTGEFDSEELAELLKLSGEKYPDMDITMARQPFTQMTEALLAGEIDLLFTSGIGELEGVKSYCIAQNKLMIAVPEHHALANRQTVEPIDLQNIPLVFFQRHASPFAFDWMVSWFKKYGLHKNIVSYEKDMQSMLYKVVAGKGVAFVSSSAIMPSDKIKKIEFIFKDNQINVNLYLIWKSENRNPSLLLFLTLLQKVL